MVVILMENGFRGRKLGLGSINGMMGMFIRENGLMERSMGWGGISGRLGIFFMVSF